MNIESAIGVEVLFNGKILSMSTFKKYRLALMTQSNSITHLLPDEELYHIAELQNRHKNTNISSLE
jgi:hypothetical protein